MKHAFVLDENVWVCAATGRNDRDLEDTSASDLLSLIAKNCHSLVFSTELWGKCRSKLSGLDNQRVALSTQVFGLLNAIAHNSEKFTFLASPDPLADETRIFYDDRYLVRLAVATESILVTTDDRLRNRVGGINVLGIHVLRPEGAIVYAQET